MNHPEIILSHFGKMWNRCRIMCVFELQVRFQTGICESHSSHAVWITSKTTHHHGDVEKKEWKHMNIHSVAKVEKAWMWLSSGFLLQSFHFDVKAVHLWKWIHDDVVCVIEIQTVYGSASRPAVRSHGQWHC